MVERLPGEWREPRHLEGMFRINLIEAQAAHVREQTVCQFWDERGFVVGECALPDLKDRRILLVYELGGQYRGNFRGEEWLPVVHAPNPIDPDRHYFLCPGCGRRSAVVAFKAAWKCPGCHQLRYRRQLISKEVAAAEAYLVLRDEIGQGRPAGMHDKTFREKSRQLARLEERFAGGELPKASLAHQRMITPEWVRPCDLRGGLWLENYRQENGVLVRMPEGWLD